MILYGEIVLSRDPDNLQVLRTRQRRASCAQGDKAHAERALEHARHSRELIQTTYKDDKFEPGGGPRRSSAKRNTIADARSVCCLRGPRRRPARPQSTTPSSWPNPATQFSRAWKARGRRRAGSSAAGKDPEALEYSGRSLHHRRATLGRYGRRQRPRALERDLSKAAWLRSRPRRSDSQNLRHHPRQLADRRAAVAPVRSQRSAQGSDGNSRLSSPDGDKLPLSSLLGKVMVLDFWATWCTPCRAQHPLYEETKTRFKDNRRRGVPVHRHRRQTTPSSSHFWNPR